MEINVIKYKLFSLDAVITTTLVDRLDALIPMYTESFNKSVTRLIYWLTDRQGTL